MSAVPKLTPAEAASAESFIDELCDLMEDLEQLVEMGYLRVEIDEGRRRYALTIPAHELLSDAPDEDDD